MDEKPLRVIVTVNGQKFRVPCSRVSDHSIGWLGADVARRYERHNKLAQNTINICELRGQDGSVLDPSDSVTDACDEMEELVGVLEYTAASVPDHQPTRAAKGVEVSTVYKGHVDSEPKLEQTIKDRGTKTELDNSQDDTEHLDSWATESWTEESVEGHRDGVTCVEWADDLVLTGGRSEIPPPPHFSARVLHASDHTA
jgi:hypothetical protein